MTEVLSGGSWKLYTVSANTIFEKTVIPPATRIKCLKRFAYVLRSLSLNEKIDQTQLINPETLENWIYAQNLDNPDGYERQIRYYIKVLTINPKIYLDKKISLKEKKISTETEKVFTETEAEKKKTTENNNFSIFINITPEEWEQGTNAQTFKQSYEHRKTLKRKICTEPTDKDYAEIVDAKTAKKGKNKCGKCRGTNVNLELKQTRAADEGATQIFTCGDCRHVWKV